MISQSQLLKWIQSKEEFQTQQVARRFRVSRQTASAHLKRLVDRGVLLKEGSTRNATYSLQTQKKVQEIPKLKLVKKLKELQVDSTLEEIERRFPLKMRLSRNVHSIFTYVFTEILGNSLAHSASSTCVIELQIEKGVFSFSVEDQGVGVFWKAQKVFHLEDEFAAAYQMFRAKPQVFSEKSPGQWVYFASKMADRFVVSSHQVQVQVDNERNDFMILQSRFRRGSKIEFSIKARSKKTLQQFYQKFAQETVTWEEQQAHVRLKGEDLISRIQARRFVAGLESYRRIVFDFAKVQGIGEAFADEIFRVFQKAHPEITLETVNANLAIQFMIARVL